MRDGAYYLLVVLIVLVCVFIGIPAAFIEWMKLKRRQQ